MNQKPKIAVIGAGLAGVRCASILHGIADVHVFEKSRGLGGRMAVRRAGAFQFDHGAQYFTAHGEPFQHFLEPFIAAGDVQKWTPRMAQLAGASSAEAPQWRAPRYVACPGMNGLAKKAATRLQVHLDTEITEILPHGAAWTLRTKTEFVSGPFDWVLCTAPPLQSARLLPVTFSDHALLADARLQGCYTLMLGFDQAPDFGWDAAIVADGPLAWIAASHSKPGRAKSSAFVCQSANDWADDNLERDQPEVRDTLLAAFCDLTGVSLQDADHVALHRWRYAKVAHPAERPFLFDPSKGLGAAGDWCGAGRVEAAFDSATALGRAVIQQIS